MEMSRRRPAGPPVRVTAGFAAGERCGIVYAMVESSGSQSLVRVGFPCRPQPALQGRDVAYHALDALVADLLERGVLRLELSIDDAHLPLDLAARRSVPSSLIVPYVSLRCKLNRFDAATVSQAGAALARDLTARAQAEISLDVAA